MWNWVTPEAEGLASVAIFHRDRGPGVVAFGEAERRSSGK